MTEFGQRCPCGTDRQPAGVAWVCPHCDRPPASCGGLCGACKQYASWQGRSLRG